MLIFYIFNKDIVDIEKADGVCSLTFAVDDFLGFLLYSSIFGVLSYL